MNPLSDYNNEHCRIAAQMWDTDAGLLDYRLIERLNEAAILIEKVGGKLRSRQVIASIMVQWSESVVDNFTK